jgi:hypothetical protein
MLLRGHRTGKGQVKARRGVELVVAHHINGTFRQDNQRGLFFLRIPYLHAKQGFVATSGESGELIPVLDFPAGYVMQAVMAEYDIAALVYTDTAGKCNDGICV